VKAGWQPKKLRDVCELINGRAYSKPELLAEGKYPVLRVGNFFTNNNWYYSDMELEPNKYCDKGDLLYAWSASFGPRIWTGEKVIFHYHIWKVQPFPLIDKRFLFMWLLWDIAQIKADQGTGTTMIHVAKGSMEDRDLLVPPLPEQRRIVGILDEAFEGIATAKANAEKNLQNARALFTAAFGAIAGGSEQEHWLRTTVAAAAAPRKGSIRTGPFGSQLLHSEFVDEGIAVLGIDNAVANEFRWGKDRFITPAKYRLLERYRVHPGDVLITIMGTCGRCAIVPDDIPVAINTKHLCCITLDRTKCLPGYLHAYFLYHPLAQEFLSKHAKGAIMSGLNMGLIEELPLLLPSLERQKKIVAALDSLKEETQRLASIYQQKLAALDELKKSLLHQAFSGAL
jgi:type I restriction enzyme, S subunit